MENPWLIQRGVIKQPIKTNVRLSQAVKLDYMGSAEFEFGALPKSLRRIESKLMKYVCRHKVKIDDELIFSIAYPSEFDIDKYTIYLKEIRVGNHQLKEGTSFEIYAAKNKYNNFDFWWDIDNDVMWSTNKIFMKKLPMILKASFDYMNSKQPA